MPSDAAPFSALQNDRAMELMREGRFEEALNVARSALSMARQTAEDSGQPNADLVVALERLGTMEKEMGEVEGAEAALTEALEMAVAIEAPLAQRASLRTSLATLLDFSQREADAVPLYEQAIADYEAMDPPEDEMGAQLRNNLAMIYKGLGKYALAEQHYLKALETLESRRGAKSEAVAAVYNNLGGLYYTAGFAEQAKEMFTEGLRVRQDLLGSSHPDVAQSFSNLATVCHELGDNDAAVEHFENSLRILEEHLKEEAASYEAVGGDYLSLLELVGEERKADALRKRMQKALAQV
jgi:tetratricopeptide (TPR) repeat protein